jgi:hypothetical protein
MSNFIYYGIDIEFTIYGEEKATRHCPGEAEQFELHEASIVDAEEYAIESEGMQLGEFIEENNDKIWEAAKESLSD